jgi:hypothetical protein
MANTFLRKLATTTTAATPVTVYTVPAATTTVVIGFMIANLTGSGVMVSIEAASTNFGTDIPIPSGASLSALDGKLVLEAADTLTVECDTLNGVEVVLSIMEAT